MYFHVSFKKLEPKQNKKLYRALEPREVLVKDINAAILSLLDEGV